MKEYAKCLYYENACFDNPIVTVRDGQNRKHLTLEEVVDKLNEQQAEIERLQKIIDLTSYQLKVQDRILKEVGE